MAKNDRVRIVQTTDVMSESGQSLVFVYEPRYDGQSFLTNPSDGTCMLEFKGGVAANSTGYINGEPIKISKAALKDYDKSQAPGFHGPDTTVLIPIFLERYQRVGWFPADNVKIVAGGVSE